MNSLDRRHRRIMGLIVGIGITVGCMAPGFGPIADAATEPPAVQHLGTNNGGVEKTATHGSAGPQMIQPPPGGGSPACQGTFSDSVANVDFQTVNLGNGNYALTWGFFLTAATQADLGYIVNVSMPVATVNSNYINPPYAPHYGYPAGYNFHGSFSKYQYSGRSGTAILHYGNVVSLGWTITSDVNSNEAWRDTACQIQ